MLDGELGDLADVVVPFLITETGETQCRLTSSTVLLGEVDGEFMGDLAGVPSEGAEECAVSVHDDEPKPGVGLEKLRERFGVELVVAEVEGPGEWIRIHNEGCFLLDVRVDGLVRLKIKRNFLFLAFVSEDRADEEHEAVGGHSVVELEPLLGAGDGCQDGETVDSGFNVGCCTVFLRQHGRRPRYLILPGCSVLRTRWVQKNGPLGEGSG